MPQDTFSFSLVLLCLAVGDIAFVRKRGRGIASTAYATGFRYNIPKSLRKACPVIAALIKEMWDGDFRKRPAMKNVVVRIEACRSFESAAASDNDLNLDEAPPGRPQEAITAREQHLELENLELKSELVDFQAIVAVNAAEIAALKAQLESRISR